MNRKNPLITFRQTDPIRLECAIDLKQLFETDNERERFDKKWKPFLSSDPYNKKIFNLDGNRLTYSSEHLVPTQEDDRPPLLLVLGNPATHSVAAGMFFAFKAKGKENRFWKTILKPAGILGFSFDEKQSAKALNAQRKKQLLEFDYESPFRVGLSVFISMPSAPGGPWGGVAGVRKLIGARALRRLEDEEGKRIVKCAKVFMGDDPRGTVITFQKNAWNGLKSEKDPEYELNKTKDGTLNGRLKDSRTIPLYGAPPTRLAGPARQVLQKYRSAAFNARLQSPRK